MSDIKIVVTADVSPIDDLQRQMLEGDPGRFIRPVQGLFAQADLVIGNLETPLSSTEAPILKCGPNFIVDPRVAPVLKSMGFGLFTLCNNHICDQGLAGLRETLHVLDMHGIPHCGAGLTHEDACSPAMITVKGRKLAVLNFGEGEFSQAQENGPGTARLEFFRSGQRVQQAREQADIVLVILHVGNEYQPIPSQLTASFCRSMADAGAHAVIAHHAHIPQATETRDGVPICFGLGNFLFGEAYDERTFERLPSWYLGTVAELDFSQNGASLVIHPFKQVQDLTLAPLSPNGRRAFDEYMTRSHAILADPERHRRFWDQEVRELSRNLKPVLLNSAQALNDPEESVARKSVASWLNLRRCESHHARIQRALRLMYEDRLDDDAAAAQELSALRNLIRETFVD